MKYHHQHSCAPRTARSLFVAAACGLVLSACTDSPTESTSGREQSPGAARELAGSQARDDRKDTPWQKLSDADLAREIERAQGRVIIGLKEIGASEGVDNDGRVLASAEAVRAGTAYLRAQGVNVLYEFKRIPGVVGIMPSALVATLRASPYVDYVEPSALGQWHSEVTPWGVDTVKAPSVWSYTVGSGVKALIIDSGIDLSHSDLYVPVAWRCVYGWLSTTDIYGHGTHVGGITGALNNSIDVVGVAPNVYLMSANVSVNNAPDVSEVACSIDVARINGVFVANMSFGLPASTAVTDQINGGYNFDNMLFVASAGNSYGGAVGYPASLTNVIAVSAIDMTKTIASFSSIGSKVELTAPGVDILSTSYPSGSVCTTGGTTALCSGTSMAAPHVTGAAALVKAYNSGWTNAQVRAHLNSTATDLGTSGRDSYYGYGLINLVAAIP